MKIKKRWLFLLVLVVTLGTCSIPEIIHVNKGESRSIGNARNGKLENGWLLPMNGENFHYFSPFSYYILNNGYVHSSVFAALMDAYKTCESTCPGKEFIIMECTRRRGGKMLFHWTHENGTSVDFMVPKKRGNKDNVLSNYAGLVHYLFKFDASGKFSLSPQTEIDFETMARHLIALDDAAQKHGLLIRKILFYTDLHDNLFNTPSGKILAERGIHFIPRLNNLVNNFHDDHYHVDFEFAGEDH